MSEDIVGVIFALLSASTDWANSEASLLFVRNFEIIENSTERGVSGLYLSGQLAPLNIDKASSAPACLLDRTMQVEGTIEFHNGIQLNQSQFNQRMEFPFAGVESNRWKITEFAK